MRELPIVNQGSSLHSAVVFRRGMMDGKIKTLTVDLPDHLSCTDFQRDIQRWHSGALVQDVLYYLTAPEREFIMTGTLPGEWDAMFPPEEEED